MSAVEEWVAELQRRFDRRAEDRESIGYCYFDRHIQVGEGEVFIRNACEKDYDALALKTKRNGGIAFTFRGIQYPETRRLYSVFAQRSELKELGIDCRLPEAVQP
jgi:hypothetical protein